MNKSKRYSWPIITYTDVYVLSSDYDRDVGALRGEIADLNDARDSRVAERLAALDALAAENSRLLEALDTAKYRIEQGRVWNGMGWTLTGLHPHGQQKALDAIDAALAGSKEVDA